jgi:hypothetical protein
LQKGFGTGFSRLHGQNRSFWPNEVHRPIQPLILFKSGVGSLFVLILIVMIGLAELPRLRPYVVDDTFESYIKSGVTR